MCSSDLTVKVIMNKNNLLYSVLIVTVLLPAIASAGYFGGGKALAMGGAYSAIADDACAIFMNPAGISQSKDRKSVV